MTSIKELMARLWLLRRTEMRRIRDVHILSVTQSHSFILPQRKAAQNATWMGPVCKMTENSVALICGTRSHLLGAGTFSHSQIETGHYGPPDGLELAIATATKALLSFLEFLKK